MQPEVTGRVHQAIKEVYTHTEIIGLTIPSFFAGKAIIHVNAIDKELTAGGISWCPEATAEICILPQ